MSTNKTPNGFNESFEDKLIIIRLCSNLSLFFFFFAVWPDAAFKHKHQSGVRQWEGWRTKLYSESELVPLHFPQRTWPAHWEKAQPTRDTHGGRRTTQQHKQEHFHCFSFCLFVCLFLFSCGPWTLMLWLTVILSILASLSVSGDCQIFFFSSCILSLLLGMGIV